MQDKSDMQAAEKLMEDYEVMDIQEIPEISREMKKILMEDGPVTELPNKEDEE